MTEVANLCQGILHFEAWRTHTQDSVSADAAFMALISRWVTLRIHHYVAVLNSPSLPPPQFKETHKVYFSCTWLIQLFCIQLLKFLIDVVGVILIVICLISCLLITLSSFREFSPVTFILWGILLEEAASTVVIIIDILLAFAFLCLVFAVNRYISLGSSSFSVLSSVFLCVIL